MATYEFQCKKCEHKFSLDLSFKEYEKLERKCPQCESKEVKRIYSSPIIQFVGSGFYINDSKDKK